MLATAPVPTDPQSPGSDAPREGPFPYRDYVLARDALVRAARAGPFYALVTGSSGTGKSSLARDLMTALESPRFQIVYVSSSAASILGLVNSLAQVLRVSPKRSSLETARVVAAALKGAPVRHVLWFDEADEVDPDTLREVRILAESELDAGQILSVVLSGLPDLRAVLDARELFPLKRRISLRCHLAGLGRDELEAFLAFRHGAAARRLPSELHDELFERTEALPALVHKVARFALERAGAASVTEAILREAFDAAL
jgi:type II secretory pathway predicted ATPase ExeA